VRFAVFFQGQGHGGLRSGKLDDSSNRNGIQAVRVHLVVVRLCGDRKRDHPRLLLEKQRAAAVPLRVACVRNYPGYFVSSFHVESSTLSKRRKLPTSFGDALFEKKSPSRWVSNGELTSMRLSA
jgi:hypothetical protein